MSLINLSHRIDSTLMPYPGDEPLRLYQNRFLEKDKYNDHRLESGMHAGTHIDSPMHLTNSPKYINEYPLESFCGDAVVLDCTADEIISYRIGFDEVVRENDIVIVKTGHEKLFRIAGYFQSHPVMDLSLAEFLTGRKIRMIGMDLPSPDRYPFEVHQLFFRHGIFILENLANLALLTKQRFKLYAFPLNICADSSPVRVVADMQD